ncbi:MAG: hypothetical protein FJ109_21230 [Deltaproteobacteria bacterium]|nr:hypothetical protein [Deltaproteobacteria bacterium]
MRGLRRLPKTTSPLRPHPPDVWRLASSLARSPYLLVRLGRSLRARSPFVSTAAASLGEVASISLLTLLAGVVLVAACTGGGGTECVKSQECSRGLVCDSGKCIEVTCTGHGECAQPYADTFCWKEIGYCSAIECGKSFPPCPAGQECIGWLCIEAKPDCENSTQCKQPVEKCYKGKCQPVDYCEKNTDCPSGECNLDDQICIELAPDAIIDVIEIEEETREECHPELYVDPTSFLCAPCDEDQDCGCGKGKCIDLGGEGRCSVPCKDGAGCPSGYTCQAEVCKPMGGQCKGCIPPPGCKEGGTTCNFKTGECVARVQWCGACAFDYECGFGNRCYMNADGAVFCAPECGAETFSCPLASGCQIRADGIYICVPTGQDCCYGFECNPCSCKDPTPLCTEDGGCAQCLTNGDCPDEKPICDQTTRTCIANCMDPTPVYWVDPADGKEYCIQCATSLDCPENMLCGTFKNKPETYHQCYEEPQ